MSEAFSVHASTDGVRHLRGVVRSNLRSRTRGICSACTANRFALAAAMSQAQEDGSFVLIESTSNQVNQDGGYTGMAPTDFIIYLHEAAREAGLPPAKIILGGDHLGPHPWRHETAESAMSKARRLVRASVLAGYVKIHIDTSMCCADDPGDARTALALETATERAALLCREAEEASSELPPGMPSPVYVIGTEVPIPGGEHAEGSRPQVTRVADLDKTLSLTREAFARAGLARAWERVIAVVVQAGVDFADVGVFEYDPSSTRQISRFLESGWNLAFEAHSTDYQTLASLRSMVEGHFAILKVGPALTFAFREAVFALAAIEAEMLPAVKSISPSALPETLDRAMRNNPTQWQRYYRGDEGRLGFARRFSYSDRSRYYWAFPEVQRALAALLDNLTIRPIPLSLLSQYMPSQYQSVREGRLRNTPAELIRNKIREVTSLYAKACEP